MVFERAQGTTLAYRDRQGRAVEVLDLVGGYGALLLGHSHPALVGEARRLLADGVPIHAQASRRSEAERLAAELARRAGDDYCVVFANSGAEAVEAALKHAMLETGGATFLALERGFHGKTLGALQLTANPAYREPFQLPGLGVTRVRPDDLGHLEACFEATSQPAGLVFEPIQGEGGVRPLSSGFVRRAAELCARRGVPLIADECQTGLGRTGRFLACEWLGVRPDYILLSKSLGGGLAKIAALLVRRSHYVQAFDFLHTSTYADDDYSCALASRTLELIDEALLLRCRRRGERLLSGLEALRCAYPDVLEAVRGRGLMIGVAFRELPESASYVLRYLSSRHWLTAVLAGYLFHAHRLRVAPTLSDPATLRLEPPALIEEREIGRVLAALGDVCQLLRRADAATLTAHLADAAVGETLEPAHPPDGAARAIVLEARPGRPETRTAAPEAQVAWLFHFMDGDDLPSLDPTLAALGSDRREVYLEAFAAFAEPVRVSVLDIRSRAGTRVRLHTILLPVTSSWMKRSLERGRLEAPRLLIERAVDAAQAFGCQVVSLGQYTSIVTRGATTVCRPGLGVTSGNAYAVALTVEALRRAHAERGRDPAESVLAVVGSFGSIGQTLVQLLAGCFRRTILVGRPGSLARLDRLARALPNATPATDLEAVRVADTVVSAVSAIDTPLGPEHFASDAVVCDVSVPPSLKAGTAAARPDLLLIRGGIARLPFGEDLAIPGFPLAPGLAYACLVEGVILGLEGARDGTFTGRLTPERVRTIARLARHHGFGLAEPERLLGHAPGRVTYGP